jgi:hypothetical protein
LQRAADQDHRLYVDFGARAGALQSMVTFEIVKESYGWAVRSGDCMMMPAWCEAVAVAEAERMVSDLRRNGQQAQITVAVSPGTVLADLF